MTPRETAGYHPVPKQRGTIDNYSGKYVSISSRGSPQNDSGKVDGITDDGFVILMPFVSFVWEDGKGLKKLIEEGIGVAVKVSDIISITPVNESYLRGHCKSFNTKEREKEN